MRPGVVGREPELAEVGRFLDAIGEGFAALVLEGEAGIGKTTVWREGRRLADERGALVLSCRPSVAEAKYSFAAVGDLLAPVGEARLAELPDPQREALEVALLRRDPGGGAAVARTTAAGFLSLMRGLTAERTVVLAIDDWQWLDLASRRVLEFALRRLEPEPVGLLASVRYPVSGVPLAAAVAEERLREIALGALSVGALGRIVSQRLGRPLARPLLVRIARATGGNPFYALEVARLVAGESELAGTTLPVPDDLRKLTAARVRRLPAAAREAVLLASVLSSPDVRLVSVEDLAPAEEAGIVTIEASGRVEFAHPLLASAAYSSVPLSRRRELHRKAARLVADPEQQARHLALGSERADPRVAGRLDEAARHAAARGAPDAAAELSELGARLTPANDAEGSGRRFVAAAGFHFDAGDLSRAEELAGRVLPESFSDALRVQALKLLTQLLGRRNDSTRASELATQALALAGDDEQLQAAMELELTYFNAGLGNALAAAEHAQAAVKHAQAAGDDAALAQGLGCLTMLNFIAGRGLDAVQFGRVLALEDPVDAPLVLRPRYFDAVMHLWIGDLDGCLQRFGQLHDETLERGQEGALPMLLLYMVQAQLWKGDLAEAGRLAEEAAEAAALLDDSTTSAVALGAAALVHAYDGNSELAHREALEGLALFERLQWRAGAIWPMWALGLLELSRGEPAAVDRVLGPLSAQVVAIGAGDPSFFVFVPDEIEALVALGELDRAQGYLEPFQRAAVDLDRAWAIAVAERCRGAIAGARGEPQAAFAAFDRALAAHALAGMPFERARTLLVAGMTYRRFKRRGMARELLEEALSVFERLGTPLWAENVRGELARVGGPGGDRDALTETERRLAELAAGGLSNQEVAERAFVTVKTVEANLTRVYRKLGVRSRVALANALRGARAEEPGSHQT